MDFLSALRDLKTGDRLVRAGQPGWGYLALDGNGLYMTHTTESTAGRWRPYHVDLLASDWRVDVVGKGPPPEKPSAPPPERSSGPRFVPLVLIDGRVVFVNPLQVSYLIAVGESSARNDGPDYCGPVTAVYFRGDTDWVKVRDNVETIARCLRGVGDGP